MASLTGANANLCGMLLAQRFKVIEKIGCGAFGEVYLGLDHQTGKRVAVKMERITPDKESGDLGLPLEFKLYMKLQEMDGVPPTAFPTVYHYGPLPIHMNREEFYLYALVMDYVGCDLESYLDQQDGVICFEKAINFGVQALDSLECLHQTGFIHGDVKPGNFLVHEDAMETFVSLVDFGMASRFRDPETGQHIQFDEGYSPGGTPEFASISMHYGEELSRRDDLECMLYTIVFLMKGSLPWSPGQVGHTEVDDEKICEAKVKATEEPSFLLAGLPREIFIFHDLVTGLEFEDDPDYGQLRKLLSSSVMTEK